MCSCRSPFRGPTFPASTGELLWNYSWPLSAGDGVFNHANIPVVTASGVAVFQTAHVANVGSVGHSKIVGLDTRTGQPVWNASTGVSGTLPTTRRAQLCHRARQCVTAGVHGH